MQKNSQNSDIIASIEPIIPKLRRRPFSTQYREKVFYIWYSHGKPGAPTLLQYIPTTLDEWGRIPNKIQTANWITEEFKPRADLLDRQVRDQLDATVVTEKVEMLKRHAELGLKMQDISIQYLNEHLDEISAPAAVRLLVEGVRIERESRGIPEALEKMTNMTDEQLMDEIKGLLTKGSISVEEIDANSG